MGWKLASSIFSLLNIITEIFSFFTIETIFESNSHSFNDILDEFCAAAGYIDHADYARQMELTDSPFNIREIP